MKNFYATALLMLQFFYGKAQNQIVNGNIVFANDQTPYFIKPPANGGAIRFRSNLGAATDRDLQFGNMDNNGTWYSFMTVAQNGNVGIGTTGPGTNLEIDGVSAPTLRINATDVNGGAGSIQFYNSSNQKWNLTTLAGTNNFALYNAGGTNNYDLTVLHSNGNVGIGTTNPQNKLEVAGSSRFGGGVDYGSSTIVSVAPGTVSFDGPGAPGARLYISGTNSYIGIGTTNPDQKLTVNGTIHSTQVKVDLNVPGPDYVFKKNYNLPALSEVKNYIDKNHHLSEIPSAAQMEKNGVDLGEMNIKLLKKVEELTLYLIEKDKKDNQQTKKIEKLEKQVVTLLNNSHTKK